MEYSYVELSESVFISNSALCGGVIRTRYSSGVAKNDSNVFLSNQAVLWGDDHGDISFLKPVIANISCYSSEIMSTNKASSCFNSFQNDAIKEMRTGAALSILVQIKDQN